MENSKKETWFSRVKSIFVSSGPGDIFIWKVGNLDKGILPSQEDLEDFKKVLNEAKVSEDGNTHIVFSDLLSLEVIRRK